MQQDIINMIFETTIAQNIYEFNYSYLTERLPYKKIELMTAIVQLANDDILLKKNEHTFVFNQSLGKSAIHKLMLMNVNKQYLDLIMEYANVV